MALKKLILCGESWAWGYELVDKQIESPDIYSLSIKSFIRLNEAEHFDPWRLYDKPENNQYRENNRYAKFLADRLGVDEIVDLSLPGASNEYIQRVLITWLSEHGYLSGKNPDDLFISIGWTSPGRREFTRQDGKLVHFGPWNLQYQYGTQFVDDFLKLYITYFASEKESAVRYFMQAFQTQKMLQSLNIKYLMHQTFYYNFHLKKIEDLHIKEKIFKSLTQAERNIWDAVDSKTFAAKETTVANYLRSQDENCFQLLHPNEHGHKKIADYFYDHIITNGLL